MTQTFENMPKIDLHCHLDGSLPIELVQELAVLAGIEISSSEKLKDSLCAPDNCSSLVEYLECFSLPIACLQTEQALQKAAFAVGQSLAAENVIYAEIRFAPLFSTAKGLTPEQAVRAVVSGLEQGRMTTGMEYGVILCAMRHQPVEENMVLLAIAEKMRGQGVVAVDLAGDEKGFPVQQYSAFFQKAAEMGIPYTIHAGEADGANSIRAALELGTKRIGHGISMKDDEALQEQCHRERIGIEMCPISNIQTKAIQNWQEYPFRNYANKGLLVTVNTDNRTVSQTNITK